MREIGLVLTLLCVLLCMASMVASFYFAIRAAKLRKPQYSFMRALSTPALLLEDYVYTDEAWPMRKRAFLCVLAFFFFCAVGVIVGVSTGAVH
jgi:hypothetical protein